jgi:hypothetical protein
MALRRSERLADIRQIPANFAPRIALPTRSGNGKSLSPFVVGRLGDERLDIGPAVAPQVIKRPNLGST